MKRVTKSKSNKVVVVSFSITQEQDAVLRAAAKQLGMKRSEIIRKMLDRFFNAPAKPKETQESQ